MADWRAVGLHLTGLRCWADLELDLPPGLTVLTGPNGAGKTSIVEALVFALLGVSPRTTREVEMIRHGAGAVRVSLACDGPQGSRVRAIGLAPGTGRKLWLDDVPVRSLGEWRARGAVLVFLPEELRAVKGPPAARRRHLDRLLEAAVPGYAESLGDYQQALVQRNALLRRVRAGLTGADGLDPWDAQLVTSGAAIAHARRTAVAALVARFAHHLEALGGAPGAHLEVETSPASLGQADDDQIAGALAVALRSGRDRDLRVGQTMVGPHRDDLWIGAGGVDLRRLGSQGEQRTAVLALLLAHREHLAGVGARPILVLDDGLSELDPDRRERLLDALSRDGQAIVTSADPGTVDLAAPRASSVVVVEDGRRVS